MHLYGAACYMLLWLASLMASANGANVFTGYEPNVNDEEGAEDGEEEELDARHHGDKAPPMSRTEEQ